MIKQISIGLFAGVFAILLARTFHLDAPKPAPHVTKTIHVPQRSSTPISNHYKSEPSLIDPNLNRIIPTVDVDDLPLEDFIDDLAKSTGATISVDWNALQEAVVFPTAKLSLHLTRPTGQQALQAALNQTADSSRPLAFQIQDGIVRVSTAQILKRNTVLRYYDVRALTEVEATNFPTTRPEPERNESFVYGFIPTGSPPAIQKLSDAIQFALGRQQTEAPGREPPPNASISYYNGNLVIRDTVENQQKIADYLAKLH